MYPNNVRYTPTDKIPNPEPETNMPPIHPKKQYPAMNMTRRTEFSDGEVVAAINSCIDLDKLNDLPSNVVDRFKNLVKHHRVRAVCFFCSEGFGLRVHKDEGYPVVFEGETEDECVPNDKNDTPGRVDLAGYWMRCPGKVWVEANRPVEKPVEYIVAQRKGRPYLKKPTVDVTEVEWTIMRGQAVVYTDKHTAETVAARMNGIVLEK